MSKDICHCHEAAKEMDHLLIRPDLIYKSYLNGLFSRRLWFPGLYFIVN